MRRKLAGATAQCMWGYTRHTHTDIHETHTHTMRTHTHTHMCLWGHMREHFGFGFKPFSCDTANFQCDTLQLFAPSPAAASVANGYKRLVLPPTQTHRHGHRHGHRYGHRRGHDTTRCDAMRCDAMLCSAMRCDGDPPQAPKQSLAALFGQLMFFLLLL